MKIVKDKINNFQFKGVYKVDCSCGKCYIGEIGRSLKIRIKEHSADIKHERTRNSTLVEHAKYSKHQIFLRDTKILAKENKYYMHRMREAICIGN